MTMRITQAMLFSRALQDIRRSSLGMLRLQEQVASGRLMNRPSDDPAKALRIMPLNNELRDLAHLKDNLGLARETIDLASATLEEASSAMARLQELMLQAANSTVSGRDRQTLSIEVNHLLEQMVGIGNLQRGDTFLFGGMRSDQPSAWRCARPVTRCFSSATVVPPSSRARPAQPPPVRPTLAWALASSRSPSRSSTPPPCRPASLPAPALRTAPRWAT
ncbi:MAG: flagellin [Planctomycetota bacterium]|jgi:hypothetical protein